MNLLSSRPVSRRMALRGLGVALGLPWLEAMTSRSVRASSVVKPPLRFAFIYTPNGYNQATFVPEATGDGWSLTPALEPLAPVKEHVTLVSGLDRTFVGGTGVHAQCGACWLTSSPPSEPLDGAFPTNTTLDQMLAGVLGLDTPLPSLELSCNDFTDNKETKYFECVSWYGPGYAASTEKDPRAVFERLFGRVAGDATRRSVLDVIGDDAAGPARPPGIGGPSQTRRVPGECASNRAADPGRRAEIRPPGRTSHGPPRGMPEQRGEYLRLMADLFVLAFRQDVTRVATLVVDPERWDSPRMYHGVFDTPQNHHVLTHTKGDEAKAKLTLIDRFHVGLFAHVVERLAGVAEGDGTLLDSCLVAMGSGISDGNTTQLPEPGGPPRRPRRRCRAARAATSTTTGSGRWPTSG